MLSRIFWILLAGLALVAGAAFQGDGIFFWSDDRVVDRKIDAAMDARVDRAVDKRADASKHDMGSAIRRLVAAETELRLAGLSGADSSETNEIRARAEAARAEVERLKKQIDSEKQLSEDERALVRTQVRQEVRETIRSAVGN